MIQELKVKNFRSFKDEVTFSFEVTKNGVRNPDYNPDKDPLLVRVSDDVYLSRFAVIYGANAAGKTYKYYQPAGGNEATDDDRYDAMKLAVDNGAKVIDDYAHHPTEIMTTLTAAKTATTGKVYCVFQPHTYTRAFKLKAEFAASFSDCDAVIVTDIYAAREKNTGLIHSRELAEAIQANSHNAQYADSFEAAETLLRSWAKPGDFVITLGAGDVNTICTNLVQLDAGK